MNTLREMLNMNDNDDTIILGTTCFNEHKNRGIPCNKSTCRYWIDNRVSQNCTIIAANDHDHTLQDIGEIFGITRMRVCQIEKNIMGKLQKRSKKLSRKLMDKKSHSP